MRNSKFLTLVAVLTFFGCTPDKMPEVSGMGSNSGALDDCIARDQCIVAYLAPWCPNCKTAIPLIHTMRSIASKEGSLGIRVIVGSDNRSRLDAMASTVGGKVFYDESGAFLHQMGQSGVPSWWVINRQNQVLSSASGSMAFREGDEVQARQFMTGYLGVKLPGGNR